MQGHRHAALRPFRLKALEFLLSQSLLPPAAPRRSPQTSADARGKTIAVLGPTFKPNTDDARDSPVMALHDLGAIVRGSAGMEQAKPLLPDVQYCRSAYGAAESADAVVIATEWEQLCALDLSRLKGVMRQTVIVDLRNACVRPAPLI
jgi:UDPglucose 6-dehydrogenase